MVTILLLPFRYLRVLVESRPIADPDPWPLIQNWRGPCQADRGKGVSPFPSIFGVVFLNQGV